MMENNKDDYTSILPRRVSSEDLEKLHGYYRNNLNQEALDYLKKRGIQETTVERFELGFEPHRIGFTSHRGKTSGYFTNCLVFPIRDEKGQLVDLMGRSIYDEKPKYKTFVGRGDIFFNEEMIEQSDDILLCRNVFDVLSLEQEELPAICVNDYASFKESHAQKLKGKRVFICYPNDESGRRESNRISSLLTESATDVYTVYLPEGLRDINYFFTKVKNPRESFHQLLQETVEESEKAPVSPDMRNLVVFFEEYQKRHNGDVQGISTGFDSLDELLVGGLRTGFYLITGLVSSGKSMLLRQIADQIAKTSEPVVYVSWDMTGFELWARSMARHLKMSPRDILTGKVPIEQLTQANQYYASTAKNMWTMEGRMDTTLDEVEEYIERIIQSIGRIPIVFIDHLFRVPLRDKQGVLIQQNHASVAYILHQWSRQWDTPIVAAAPQQVHEQSLPSSVEAAVDVILSLETTEEKNGEQCENISLQVKKNRNGTLGQLSFVFDKEKAIFFPSQS
ncbi:DnaB-like helicase C-terminal domain-containing protein [Ammoniphilus sp. CFH 90114]|uniref:DnaB-like helicase C-terminal domain-containing protein n=1 Tax=Ammoniphilus sp. CFH 90114 TaxID=2493665 RepID=UPI00100F9B6E|nr:DnaB-like helicase C-terminal domain-containing protein [Ammoniphilus sp. CFH 90114]RXT13877.1 DNA primase [Ammoniphilus sp. CFH 90114]